MTDATASAKAQPWEGPLHLRTTAFFVLVHLLGVVGIVYAFYAASEAVVALAFFLTGYFFVGQLATTLAAHRLYAHKAFEAALWLEFVLVVLFSGNAQGSIIFWAGWHKLHHAKEDTDEDPHSPEHGFWWAHMLWVMKNGGFTAPPDRYMITPARSKAAMFQHKWNLGLQAVMAWGLPAFVGYLAGDALLGFLLANTRLVPQYHLTWVINSVCHLWGHRDGTRTSTNINLLALFTAGEANHDKHHAAPRHYQIGRGRGDYDMGAWVLRQLSKVGAVWNLQEPVPKSR